MLTGHGGHPTASIVSNSWQIPLGVVAAQTVHAIDLRAVAEGAGMYFASGDGPGLNVTNSDPDATAVGGTTLGIGAANNRVFETGWSDIAADADLDTGILTGYIMSVTNGKPGLYQTMVNAGTSLACPLRHDDGRRHTKRCRLHRRAAPSRTLTGPDRYPDGGPVSAGDAISRSSGCSLAAKRAT